MTPTLANNLTHYFTARWHRGPKVHIAPTARDLPVPAPDDARGLYLRGDVHLVAAQPLDSLAQTLAHEAIGHHGLRQLMGSEWKHFMRHISDGIRAGEPGLQQIRRHIRHSYTDDAGRYMLTSRQEADEVAAYVAEEMVCYATGSIKPARPLLQAFEAAKGRFLREGLCLDRNVSRSELEGALLLADMHLRGWPWFPIRHRLRSFWDTCSNILGMSKPDLHKPPMSWSESKRLLQKEEQRLHDKAERYFLWNGFVLLLAIIVFFGGIALFVSSFFGR